MRVFMTGATGFIGSGVTAALRERGHEVAGLVRSRESAAKLAAMGGRPVSGDVREPGGWTAEAASADALIHLAAIQMGRRGGASWLRALRAADLAATRALVEAAAAGGRCRALVYTSGFLAVGHHGDAWVDEDTPAVPGARGEAYLEGERLVTAACRQGLPGVCLRLGWVYGAAGFFAKMILPQAAKGSFTHIGDGGNFMPTVSLADVIDAYVRAVEKPPAGAVLNIVDDDPLRMREIGTVLLAEFGGGKVKGLPVWLAALFAGGPVAEAFSGSYRTRNGKAKAALGWTLRYPVFREGIGDVVAEYRRATGQPTLAASGA